MTEKLIALDLDGTLLNKEGKISDFSRDILNQIRKQGHKIIISTGRPFHMAHQHYDFLRLDTPMISFNGALTHIPRQKWQHEQDLRLDKEVLLDLVEREEEIEAIFIAGEYRHKFYITHTHHKQIDPELFGVTAITPATRFEAHKVTENPNAILLETQVADKYALAKELRHFYQNQIEIGTWGGPFNILECSPKGVTKAFALKHLLNVYRKTPQDLIAFGDEHNDVEMFDLAGTSVAMKNASAVLLPHANQQTQFNHDEDGVARHLAALFL